MKFRCTWYYLSRYLIVSYRLCCPIWHKGVAPWPYLCDTSAHVCVVCLSGNSWEGCRHMCVAHCNYSVASQRVCSIVNRFINLTHADNDCLSDPVSVCLLCCHLSFQSLSLGSGVWRHIPNTDYLGWKTEEWSLRSAVTCQEVASANLWH